jgi:hypothetical protein
MMHGSMSGMENKVPSVMELEMSAQLHALVTLFPNGINHVTNQTGLKIHIG